MGGELTAGLSYHYVGIVPLCCASGIFEGARSYVLSRRASHWTVDDAVISVGFEFVFALVAVQTAWPAFYLPTWKGCDHF